METFTSLYTRITTNEKSAVEIEVFGKQNLECYDWPTSLPWILLLFFSFIRRCDWHLWLNLFSKIENKCSFTVCAINGRSQCVRNVTINGIQKCTPKMFRIDASPCWRWERTSEKKIFFIVHRPKINETFPWKNILIWHLNLLASNENERYEYCTKIQYGHLSQLHTNTHAQY